MIFYVYTTTIITVGTRARCIYHGGGRTTFNDDRTEMLRRGTMTWRNTTADLTRTIVPRWSRQRFAVLSLRTLSKTRRREVSKINWTRETKITLWQTDDALRYYDRYYDRVTTSRERTKNKSNVHRLKSWKLFENNVRGIGPENSEQSTWSLSEGRRSEDEPTAVEDVCVCVCVHYYYPTWSFSTRPDSTVVLPNRNIQGDVSMNMEM